jgi:hypothetical protein
LNWERVKDFKGQAFAVGPKFRHYIKNMHLTFKYQFEALVKKGKMGTSYTPPVK